MISVLLFSSLFFLFSCLSKNNPVKMKMNLMISSILIFYILKILSSNSWMPLIFCMLFLGGILMMFMILSTFLPNSMMKKNHKYKLMMMMTIFFFSPLNLSSTTSPVVYLKVFMEEKINFMFMMIWILAIFFGFILIMGDARTSMRSSITN